MSGQPLELALGGMRILLLVVVLALVVGCGGSDTQAGSEAPAADGETSPTEAISAADIAAYEQVVTDATGKVIDGFNDLMSGDYADLGEVGLTAARLARDVASLSETLSAIAPPPLLAEEHKAVVDAVARLKTELNEFASASIGGRREEADNALDAIGGTLESIERAMNSLSAKS